MTAEIRAAASPGEVRIAVLDDGVLTDYAVWRPGRPDGVGDVHRGRVIRHVPAMAGAFVAIGGPVDGFLPDSEGGRGLTEGTVLPVRITRAAQGGKGPRLSARDIDAVPADGGVGLIRPGPDPITRLAATYPTARIVVDDAALFARLRPGLAARLALLSPAFDDALEAEVETLAEPVVTLPDGMRLAFHPTPALTAIDIDSGSALTRAGGKAERHLAMNRTVMTALARQIRLRNLSGAILVDFAGMAMRRRTALAGALAEALAADPLRPRLLGFTALGLAEILRPRVHPPLHEVLAGPHAAGLAALRAVAARAAAAPGLRPVLRAAPAVVSALHADAVALRELAHRTGHALMLRADPALPGATWILDDRDA